MDALKLRLKIGTHEFEAEGNQDTVLAAFERFWQTIGEQAPSSEDRPPSSPLRASHQPDVSLPSSSQQARYAKLFREDQATGLLALRACPQTPHREADALLLLLLGYLREKDLEAVPVLTLTKSLARSGFQVKRVDRLLSGSARSQQVLKAGRGKGGTYRLTAQGVRRAEEIARELVQLLP